MLFPVCNMDAYLALFHFASIHNFPFPLSQSLIRANCLLSCWMPSLTSKYFSTPIIVYFPHIQYLFLFYTFPGNTHMEFLSSHIYLPKSRISFFLFRVVKAPGTSESPISEMSSLLPSGFFFFFFPQHGIKYYIKLPFARSREKIYSW